MLSEDRNQKKVQVAIHLSGKIDFKTKTVMRNREGNFIMKKDQSTKKI